MLTSYQAAIGVASGILFGPFLHYIGHGSATRLLIICGILRCISVAGSGILAPPNIIFYILFITPLPLSDTLSREAFQLPWSARGVSVRDFGKVSITA